MLRHTLLALLLSGCAIRQTGFCHGTADGAELRALDGRIYPLKLSSDSEPLHYLHGHTTEVEGRKILKRIQVEDWRIHDGLHGLAVWVGPLVAYGVHTGIQDRNSGVFYTLDPAATRDLKPYMGEVVLVEGWVEGARQVKVAYFRVLAELPEDP